MTSLTELTANAGLFDADFISQSPAMLPVKEAATRAAADGSAVMISGETGAGKEMLARFIHAHSSRAAGPFIPVDCAALPDDLFESQLFGDGRSLGAIRAAQGGTLFLDDIANLSSAMQAGLLNIMRQHQSVAAATNSAQHGSLRIICATNRDLVSTRAGGEFDHNLYTRLHEVCITVPPMRERYSDLFPLAAHFLQKLSLRTGEPPKTLSEQAVASFSRYHWPGNVRELFNVLEHSFVLSESSSTIELEDLPPILSGVSFRRRTIPDFNLNNAKRRAVMEAMRRARNNHEHAALLLGVEPRRLSRRLESLGNAFPTTRKRAAQ